MSERSPTPETQHSPLACIGLPINDQASHGALRSAAKLPVFLFRVKRLGCFDHAQRQLGERCLYVFPAKVEPAKIAWECPEKNCAQGEGSMAKKVCP